MPDPTKPVWDQDAAILDILLYVDKEIARERISIEKEKGLIGN